MQSSRLTLHGAIVGRARRAARAAARAIAAAPRSTALLVASLLAASPAPALALAQAQPQADRIRAAVAQHRERNELAVIEELRTLLAVPNVAADLRSIRRNAELLVQMLERRGVSARLLELADEVPPAVYGELNTPGATRTVVLYAHYDGQPVEGGNWATPPWEPTLRAGRLEDGARVVPWPEAHAPLPDEWRIYARSASDDKSPIVAYLAALDALEAADIAPSVNLKFFLEGEEEAGSPNLRRMLERHADLLRADLWIFGDGPVHQTRRMQTVFGVRGIVGGQITVYGPARVLHSGHYGNWAPNPAVMLVQLLASMRDDEGNVAIQGFYDDVQPLTAADRAALAALPPVEDDLRVELALGRTEGGARLAELIMRPAFNLDGIAAGGVGSAARNAIPDRATAAFDIRLVPDLAPARVKELVERHIRAQGYHIVREEPSPDLLRAHARVAKLTWGDGYAAMRTPLDLPASRAVTRSISAVLGEPVLEVPILGGSLPLSIFQEVLGTPLVIVPMVNHDNNQHAPNENLRLRNLWDGILVYAGLIAGMGAAWRGT
ncbi:MAG TPA: M20/M25/M40 family metallo-hydrolase [Longimicrobiales bacterium]